MSYNDRYDETVSMGEWIVTALLCAIPIVNIVLILVWAFGSSVKPSKRNFFRAQLLLAAIGIVLGIAVAIALSVTDNGLKNLLGLLLSGLPS